MENPKIKKMLSIHLRLLKKVLMRLQHLLLLKVKICGNADKALAALRSALKKERGNAKLYSQFIDICYQRQPIDVTGVTAAIGQQGPH